MKDSPIPDDPVGGRLSVLAEEGTIPGAVYHVESPRGTICAGAVGWAAREPAAVRATTSTLYDLASVTKAASTSILALLAERDGVLPANRPLGRILPELLSSPWEKATPEDCLLHRTGLPAWAPLYCLAPRREDTVSALARLAPPDAPSGGVRYSDLGPILVGIALERAWSADLGEIFRDRIARPLRLRATTFRPEAGLRERTAPTERGNANERSLADGFPGRPCEGRPWPETMWHGVPHDGNARFLGGAAGHAGLFAVASELAALGREVLGPEGRVLERPERARLLAPADPGSTQPRCLFGRMARGDGSPAAALGPRAAGHVGFTGTSLFVDPDGGTVHVLLTNRVHPVDRRDGRMTEVRREFHRLSSGMAAGRAVG